MAGGSGGAISSLLQPYPGGVTVDSNNGNALSQLSQSQLSQFHQSQPLSQLSQFHQSQNLHNAPRLDTEQEREARIMKQIKNAIVIPSDCLWLVSEDIMELVTDIHKRRWYTALEFENEEVYSYVLLKMS